MFPVNQQDPQLRLTELLEQNEEQNITSKSGTFSPVWVVKWFETVRNFGERDFAAAPPSTPKSWYLQTGNTRTQTYAQATMAYTYISYKHGNEVFTNKKQ